MKRTLILASLVLMIAAGTASADHGRRTAGPMNHPGFGRHIPDGDFDRLGMMLRWADEIKLTDDQKSKLEQMALTHHEMMIDKKAELEKAELQLRHMRRNDAPESEVLALMDQVGRLRTGMQKARYQHRKEVEGVLTTDQLDKLENLRRDRFRDRADRDCDGTGQRKRDGSGDRPRSGQGR